MSKANIACMLFTPTKFRQNGNYSLSEDQWSGFILVIECAPTAIGEVLSDPCKSINFGPIHPGRLHHNRKGLGFRVTPRNAQQVIYFYAFPARCHNSQNLFISGAKLITINYFRPMAQVWREHHFQEGFMWFMNLCRLRAL